MAIETDPASQTSGLVKWASGIVAGFLISKFKLDPTTAGGVAGALLTIGTAAWQVLHRLKTNRAIQAAAALPPSASDATVAQTVKAA